MKREKKKYEHPSRPWDKERIGREKKIREMFGLKNKKEIWRAEAIVRKFRRIAREVAATHDKEKEQMLINKMIKLGLINEGAAVDDVLSLTVEDLLERRLQTMVKNKGFANNVKQARQLITHGHIKINNRKVIYPSYIVPRSEEDLIVADIPVKVKRAAIETPQAVEIVTEVKQGETNA